MTDLDPNFGKSYDLDNNDPVSGEKLPGNRLRAQARRGGGTEEIWQGDAPLMFYL